MKKRFAIVLLLLAVLAPARLLADEDVFEDPEANIDAIEGAPLEGTPLPQPADSTVEPKEAIADHTQYLTDDEMKLSRPWNPPTYTGQVGALGWSETVFTVPTDLRSRVDFWRDIYTKYTTDQGVIHDTRGLVVYEPIDFKAITDDAALSTSERRKKKERTLLDKKMEIMARLYRLHLHLKIYGGPTGLTGEDLRVWHLLDRSTAPDRFLEAASKKHVRFQLGQKDKFYVGLYNSGRYLTLMEKIFREEGLPIELTRLPFVESSFNIRARSRVGASGVWQFMRRTARPYMKVNNQVDERNDPLKATRASARMLRANYQMLESWPLALTGYNHGPSGVRRIVEKVGSRDLGRIIDVYSSKTFGFASENFYACFLAALEAERSAKTYFADPRWGPPIDSVEVPVVRNTDYKKLLKLFDGDEGATELFNPHLSAAIRSGRAKIPAKTYIRVKPESVALASDLVAGRGR